MTNICTMSSPGRDEAMTNPTMADSDESLKQDNTQDHKSISFDVYNDDYSEFIQKVRDELRDSVSHGIPVLTPQRPETAENAAWLDIRLVAGDHSITVRLEQSNLYVRGYARSTDDFFWEFTDTHLITGSRDLLFSGSYIEANGIANTAGVAREELPLGGRQLENAIHNLAKLESPLGSNNQAAARYLLVLIQMIAEAARYRTISEYIYDNYWEDNGAMITSRMLAMENGWGQLSTAVLHSDQDPIDSTPLPNIPAINPTQVYTLGQAVAALGILVITRPRGGSTIMTMNSDSDSGSDYGRCLMNLEYVRVNNIDGEDPGDLYGTVKVDDGWYTYTFYDRSSDDYESVGPGGFATLTDSCYSHAVSGADALTISVDLYDYDWLSPDEIAHGEIAWDCMVESVSFENYDKHLQQVVKGEYGDVTVGYSVLSNALSVTVQVLLIDCDGEDLVYVYGTLGASQVLKGSDALTPITLFDKPSDEYVEVRPGEAIPLIRTVIAASTATQLSITADLWEYDWLWPEEIAQGSADFTVEPGTQSQYIDGQYGQVQVTITCE